MGLIRPGRTLALAALWQRLNFLPLPHQHGSFALSTPWRVDRSVTATKAIGATMDRCRRSTRCRPCAVEPRRGAAGADARWPCRSARLGAHQASRDVLLVHVAGDEAEGWAECAVEPAPGYSAEFTDATALAAPRPPRAPGCWRRPRSAMPLALATAPSTGSAATRWRVRRSSWPCSTPSSGRPAARWPTGSAPPRPRVRARARALGLHDDIDDLLAEADAALAAGAARLRVKIAPGRAAEAAAPRSATTSAPTSSCQADANGSFARGRRRARRASTRSAWPASSSRSPPDDLLGHARLAARLDTPICLDEPLTSLAAIEAAIALGACEVVCLKPARVGGWIAARAVHDRCAELGVPVWVGGMLETGVGRAANLAVAALPHMALPPDLDPRGRFDPDLADPRLPVDGAVAVPDGPRHRRRPRGGALGDAEVVGAWAGVP